MTLRIAHVAALLSLLLLAGCPTAEPPPDDAGVCACDATGACDDACACDPDCGGCACDVTSTCDTGCACDADCGGCACDVTSTCDTGCACDADCGGCACDVTSTCDTGCACDADCGGCACDVAAGCDAGCDCDPECTPGVDLCADSCAYPSDGECDDGGSGAATELCAYGTDCADCGPRPATCVPTCDGRECGGDGCGGTCGACVGVADCLGFTCVECACDVSTACDVGCESCDPECCVEPTRPTSVATASCEMDVRSEDPIAETGTSTRLAVYRLVVDQRAVSDGAREIVLDFTSTACAVTGPPPPSGCSVVTRLTDAAPATTEIEIRTSEPASGSACATWLRSLTTAAFDLECTRGALRFQNVCDRRTTRAAITERWTATVHH